MTNVWQTIYRILFGPSAGDDHEHLLQPYEGHSHPHDHGHSHGEGADHPHDEH